MEAEKGRAEKERLNKEKVERKLQVSEKKCNQLKMIRDAQKKQLKHYERQIGFIDQHFSNSQLRKSQTNSIRSLQQQQDMFDDYKSCQFLDIKPQKS